MICNLKWILFEVRRFVIAQELIKYLLRHVIDGASLSLQLPIINPQNFEFVERLKVEPFHFFIRADKIGCIVGVQVCHFWQRIL